MTIFIALVILAGCLLIGVSTPFALLVASVCTLAISIPLPTGMVIVRDIHGMLNYFWPLAFLFLIFSSEILKETGLLKRMSIPFQVFFNFKSNGAAFPLLTFWTAAMAIALVAKVPPFKIVMSSLLPFLFFSMLSWIGMQATTYRIDSQTKSHSAWERILPLADWFFVLYLASLVFATMFSHILLLPQTSALLFGGIVFYAVLVSGVLYAETSFSRLSAACLRASKKSSFLMFTFAAMYCLSRIVTMQNEDADIAKFFISITLSADTFLIVTFLLLGIASFFVDAVVVGMIGMMLFTSTATIYGVDQVYYCFMVCLCVMPALYLKPNIHILGIHDNLPLCSLKERLHHYRFALPVHGLILLIAWIFPELITSMNVT